MPNLRLHSTNWHCSGLTLLPTIQCTLGILIFTTSWGLALLVSRQYCLIVCNAYKSTKSIAYLYIRSSSCWSCWSWIRASLSLDKSGSYWVETVQACRTVCPLHLFRTRILQNPCRENLFTEIALVQAPVQNNLVDPLQ